MIFEQDQLLGGADRFVAGTVAGFSILALDDSSRRRTFALYLLARVAQVGWCPNPTFSSALCMSLKNLCSNNNVNLVLPPSQNDCPTPRSFLSENNCPRSNVYDFVDVEIVWHTRLLGKILYKIN